MRHGWLGLVVFTLSGVAALAQEPQTLASGSWIAKSQKIEGSWVIVQEPNGRFLILSDDFKTKQAPDLKIFLSAQPTGSLTSKNATEDAFLVAPLQSSQGPQRYALREDLALDDYQTLMIHCERYTKLWGVAPLP